MPRYLIHRTYTRSEYYLVDASDPETAIYANSHTASEPGSPVKIIDEDVNEEENWDQTQVYLATNALDVNDEVAWSTEPLIDRP